VHGGTVPVEKFFFIFFEFPVTGFHISGVFLEEDRFK